MSKQNVYDNRPLVRYSFHHLLSGSPLWLIFMSNQKIGMYHFRTLPSIFPLLIVTVKARTYNILMSVNHLLCLFIETQALRSLIPLYRLDCFTDLFQIRFHDRRWAVPPELRFRVIENGARSGLQKLRQDLLHRLLQ